MQATASVALDLAAAIDTVLSDPAFRHGASGVLVESLRDGRTIYSRNADKIFMPGSNMKLLTTAAALDALGPGCRFRTRFYFNGRASDHVWRGDLYIKGGGDPTLRSEHLEEFARSLRRLGARRIDGAVVADDTWFRGERLGSGWGWDDEQWYYAAPIGALSLNGNSVQVFVMGARRAGSPPVVRIVPPTSVFVVRNQAVTVGSGEARLSVTRPHGASVILVRGTVPCGYRSETPVERISVPDPALYAATSLMEALGRAGIAVRDRPKAGATPKTARLLHTHVSPPLSEILALVNKRSDNTMAEVLFRTLAAGPGGAATEDEARAAETAFLKKAGGDPEAALIADGSGLSRRNYISPANIIAVLRYMYGRRDFGAFVDSLPVAGRDGTLKSRMKGTIAEGNVRAKTGYLAQASSLSGYLTTSSGEPLVFSILMNNHTCPNTQTKAAQDRICDLLRGLP